jgi:hypothetical protein
MMRIRLAHDLRILARLALSATIVLIPFRYRFVLQSHPLPPIYRDYTDLLLFASDIFLIATLVAWALSLALEPRCVTTGPFFLSLPVLGVTGMGVLSTLFSVDPLLSFYHSVRLILLGGVYLYVLNEIRGLGEIVVPLSIQVFIQSAIGIGQVLQQHSLGLKFLDELELDPAWNGVSIVWSGGMRSLRAYGLSDHPNILGGCFALALVLISIAYVKADAKWRASLVSVFALGALGLLLTFSRSAWVAFGAASILVAALFLKTHQTRAMQNWLALMVAGLILVAPFIGQNAGYLGMRFDVKSSFTPDAPENRSIAERSSLNAAVNAIFTQHAITGVGLGAVPIAMRNRFPDFPFNYQPAHVALLDVAAEVGIFGALFYMLAMLGPWLALGLNRSRLALSPTMVGMTGLLMAITVIGLFDYYTWLLAPGRLWQWLAWGWWATFYQSALTGRPVPAKNQDSLAGKEAHYA